LHNLIVVQQNSNLFENRQTVAQTVKPHHTQSNCVRDSFSWANCLTVHGALNARYVAFVKGPQRLIKIYHRIILGRILKTRLAQQVPRKQHFARDTVWRCLPR
jgi:hypothetical protein